MVVSPVLLPAIQVNPMSKLNLDIVKEEEEEQHRQASQLNRASTPSESSCRRASLSIHHRHSDKQAMLCTGGD